jgi:hypothetical protein
MTSRRKKILAVLAILTVLICLSFFLIIRNANEMLKTELEKSLGKDFRVERIVLNWGSVDGYGIRYFREGEEIARADSLKIRADFMGFLKRQYSVSSISVVKPYLTVVIDREGRLLLPFVSGGNEKKGVEIKKSSTAFEAGKLIIDNGEVHIVDERLPANHNSIDVRDLNLRFDNLAYPFEDTLSRFDLSAVSAGRLISGKLSAEGKINLKTAGLDILFKGSDMVLLDSDKIGPILSADRMAFSVISQDSREGKVYTFDDAIIKKPHVRYETDMEGNLISPWRDIIKELQSVVSSSLR